MLFKQYIYDVNFILYLIYLIIVKISVICLFYKSYKNKYYNHHILDQINQKYNSKFINI